jgi:hypothetical protein
MSLFGRRMHGREEVVREREKFVLRRNELDVMRLFAMCTHLSPHRLQTVGPRCHSRSRPKMAYCRSRHHRFRRIGC